MKKYLKVSSIFFVLLAALMVSCFNEGGKNELSNNKKLDGFTDYYWNGGNKVGINLRNDKEFILFKASDEQNVVKYINKERITMYGQPQVVTFSKIVSDKVINKEVLEWLLVKTSENLKAQSEILYGASNFITGSGEELVLSHLFYVKLKDKKDLSKLTELALVNNVEIIGYNESMPLWYTLACSKSSTGNALELANKFYETNLFAACQPDLMTETNLGN